MFDLHPRIGRFRVELISAGFLSIEADEIIDGLNNEISVHVRDLVIDAVDNAISVASNMGADKFIDDVTVDSTGYIYRITTRSGQTDYSTLSIDMKPHLLKSGKVSNSGKRYRRVPLEDRSAANDMFDVQAEQHFQQERERRDRAATNRVANEIFPANNDIAQSVNDMAAARKRFYDMKEAKHVRGEINIRTVSDDSPADSWIIPARDLDMTTHLYSINEQLAASIDAVIENTVDFYAEEFI